MEIVHLVKNHVEKRWAVAITNVLQFVTEVLAILAVKQKSFLADVEKQLFLYLVVGNIRLSHQSAWSYARKYSCLYIRKLDYAQSI